jgi:hypothetical protein
VEMPPNGKSTQIFVCKHSKLYGGLVGKRHCHLAAYTARPGVTSVNGSCPDNIGTGFIRVDGSPNAVNSVITELEYYQQNMLNWHHGSDPIMSHVQDYTGVLHPPPAGTGRGTGK